MRVLITGMGGEVGTRVAQLLEERHDVSEIVGVDFVPPRRRLRHSEFRRIDPRERDRLAAFAADFAPDAVAHVGIYEPGSRLPAKLAARYTEGCAVAALGGAARAGKLGRIALRSGIQVYGRGPGRPGVPDEDGAVAPTTPFGRTLLALEARAADVGRRLGIPVTALRVATIAGSHMPSPLGRVLRLPAVPVPALADPVFQLIHADDVARAIVAALWSDFDGPVNVVGPGAASVWQAVRLGGRVPVPTVGPMWRLAAQAVELAGAPAPPHVLEVLQRGSVADGSRAGSVLGLEELRSTHDVCTELYEWGTVTPLRPAVPVAEASRG
jgi:UDP-glucose 4-epimerase